VDNVVALAALSLAGALATGFFALVNKQNIAKALDKVAGSNELIARETHQGNVEAKERNGHLGDQNIQITKMIGDMTEQIKVVADRNYSAIRNVQEQHVANQIVETETVINKDA
jgi:hypothetical protein